MIIPVDTEFALKNGLYESLVFGYLSGQDLSHPVKFLSMQESLGFIEEEVIFTALISLENLGILTVERIDSGVYKFELSERINSGSLTSPTKHLENTLESRMELFVSQKSEHINKAIALGLAESMSESVFQKFVNFVLSDPKRFKDSKLESYWLYFSGNAKDMKKDAKVGRAELEMKNADAAAQFLASHGIYSSPLLTSEKDKPAIAGHIIDSTPNQD